MVIGLLVILTLILLLIMIGAIWGINVAMARMVGDKHRALEEISATGQVPTAWRRRYEKRLSPLREDPARQTEAKAIAARAGADYIARLDKLIRYVETTSLVEGDDTRALLIEKLKAARTNWLAEDRPAE